MVSTVQRLLIDMVSASQACAVLLRSSRAGDYNLKCQSGGDSRSSNSFALNAYWQPEDPGFIPSVSVGWALNTINGDNIADGTYTTSQSWFTGLKWDDVFIDGNDLGFAFGQPTFATALKGDSDTPYDGNYAFELYYNYKVTDNITVTPAVFYLSRPEGQLTQSTATNEKRR